MNKSSLEILRKVRQFDVERQQVELRRRRQIEIERQQELELREREMSEAAQAPLAVPSGHLMVCREAFLREAGVRRETARRGAEIARRSSFEQMDVLVRAKHKVDTVDRLIAHQREAQIVQEEGRERRAADEFGQFIHYQNNTVASSS